ncbi:MAG: GNAT family N-acetyltransferase [Anaerovoracaceae bacterium]
MARIETGRLLLRPLAKSDAEEFYEYAKSDNVGPHAGWKPHESVEETEKIIEEIFLPNESFAIIHKETGRLIGVIALEPDKRRPDIPSREIGYSLSEEFWGCGYMTEAAKAVIKYGFEELGLEVIAICTSLVNERSARVIEKCGFKFEGVTRRCYKIYDGTARDSRVYSMLKEEWENQR